MIPSDQSQQSSRLLAETARALQTSSNVSRRNFLGQLGALGASYFLTATGFSQNAVGNANDYMPYYQIQWISDSFVWAAGLVKNDVSYRVLIRQKPGREAEVLMPLGGPVICRFGSGPLVYGLGANESATLIISGPSVTVQRLEDNGVTFEAVRMADARELNRLQSTTFPGLDELALGRNCDGEVNLEKMPPMLACRPSGKDATEILLFDGPDDPRSVLVDWPLAHEHAVIFADPNSGDWLAYPRMNWDRRRALEKRFKGIPVCRVTPTFELSLTWVPWADWNKDAPYCFYPLGSDLICATRHRTPSRNERFSGVYFSENGEWSRRFACRVEISSLAVSSDAGTLAWIEEIQRAASAHQGRQTIHIVRIETT